MDIGDWEMLELGDVVRTCDGEGILIGYFDEDCDVRLFSTGKIKSYLFDEIELVSTPIELEGKNV